MSTARSRPTTTTRGCRRPLSAYPLGVSLRGQKKNTTLRSARKNFSYHQHRHTASLTDDRQRDSAAHPTLPHMYEGIISIAHIHYPMARETVRDRCWNRTLTLILKGGVVHKADLTKAEGVSDSTAADVLNTMEKMGWIKRDPAPGPKPDRWRRGQQLPATLSTEKQ